MASMPSNKLTSLLWNCVRVISVQLIIIKLFSTTNFNFWYNPSKMWLKGSNVAFLFLSKYFLRRFKYCRDENTKMHKVQGKSL